MPIYTLDEKINWAADRIMQDLSGGSSLNMSDRWKEWARGTIRDAIYLDLAGETIPNQGCPKL